MPNILLDPKTPAQTKTVFSFAAQGAGTLTQIFEGTQELNGLVLLSDITGVSGTPTLDIYIQKQLPDGTYTDMAHLTQQTTATKRYADIALCGSFGAEALVQDGALAAGTINARIFGPTVQVKAVIAGTTPTFTGTVKIRFERYKA
jgi:hypothetical protein